MRNPAALNRRTAVRYIARRARLRFAGGVIDNIARRAGGGGGLAELAHKGRRHAGDDLGAPDARGRPAFRRAYNQAGGTGGGKMNGISLSAADTCRGPLVLVNAQHPYRGGAPALSPALGAEDILLEKTAAALLAECVRAAGAAGEVVPVSGWRPRAQQQSIWNDTMEKEGEAFTKQFVAKQRCADERNILR